MTLLHPSDRIFVAGLLGNAGSAIVRALAAAGYTHLLTAHRSELDLEDGFAVRPWFKDHKPEVVVLAAAKVGGIHLNDTYPADFLLDNLKIKNNVIESAWRSGTHRLLLLGSNCIYHCLCFQPFKEEFLLTMPLEPTNEWYSSVKIFSIQLCRVRRIHKSNDPKAPTVTCWSTKPPLRDFLHADDLASAALHFLEDWKPKADDLIQHNNVGTRVHLRTKEFAELLAKNVGYQLEIGYDSNKLNGTPKKQLDISRLAALGWRARVKLGWSALWQTLRSTGSSTYEQRIIPSNSMKWALPSCLRRRCSWRLWAAKGFEVEGQSATIKTILYSIQSKMTPSSSRHTDQSLKNQFMTKTALIAGITGQDGAYLAHHLLDLDYRVVGTSRDSQICDTSRLKRLNIVNDIELVSLAPNDFRSVLKVVSSIKPVEIYNLAGQTSVGLSFEQPVECMDSISGATINLLEVIRYLDQDIRYFSAGSSECFGDIGEKAATEETPLHPRSPYAVAKSASFWQVSTYRDAYGMFACTGILANHESPLRPKRFVTQKIVDGVKSIRAGTQDKLQLGNLEVWRDWGWAPDYVKAMHLMLQAEKPKDYLIASGTTSSLRSFVENAFEIAGLESKFHLSSIETLKRPADLSYSAMDPSRIQRELGWASKRTTQEIVKKMYEESLF